MREAGSQLSSAGPPVARLNEVGDVVLEDVRQLQALADRDRLATFERLQRHGPRPTGELAVELGLRPETVEDGLRVLAEAGLVEERDALWRAIGRGLFVQARADDVDAGRAARALGVLMLEAAADLPRHWLNEVEPGLDAQWAAAAGLFNAGAVLTPDEVEHVQEELERTLEPYLNRGVADRPPDARRVRLVAYFLPGAGGEDADG
jgi:DNA-binding transcriptional ArsR family regulator